MNTSKSIRSYNRVKRFGPAQWNNRTSKVRWSLLDRRMRKSWNAYKVRTSGIPFGWMPRKPAKWKRHGFIMRERARMVRAAYFWNNHTEADAVWCRYNML